MARGVAADPALAQWTVRENTDTLAEVKQIATFLQSKLIDWKPEDVSYIYFGVEETTDFYGVYDCTNPDARKDRKKDCEGHDYLFGVSNDAIFPDTRIRSFALSDEGKVGRLVAVGKNEYNPTERPWWTSDGGWAIIYNFYSATASGRTYSTPFNGGFVAADTVSGVCEAAVVENSSSSSDYQGSNSDSSSSSKERHSRKKKSRSGRRSRS